MSPQKQKRLKHIPQRTCIVCRRKVDKRLLTRVVRTQAAGVVVDPTGKRNGRGAYVCGKSACWGKITVDARLLNQALIAEVSDEELAAIAMHKPVETHREMGSTENA